ncbi:MAG: hypothetical protein CMM47_04925 [Rhodospirillaceae bacterium]|nr:hypothetical protein [Rhodospirillaceae bacterium]
MNKICFNFIRSALAIASIALIVNCEGGDLEYNYPQSGPRGLPTYEKQESIFGEGGLTLFGGGPGAPEARPGGGAGVGVNSFLWRASLDTVSFMPLQSADPFGGVIITDWYAPPNDGGERFKVNIFILDRALRADGVRATVFKQQRGVNGGWVDARVDEKLDRQVEDAILTRAREMRIRTVPQSN